MRVVFFLFLLLLGNVTHSQDISGGCCTYSITATLPQKITKHIANIFFSLEPENRKKLLQDYLMEFDQGEKEVVKTIIRPALQNLLNNSHTAQEKESFSNKIHPALQDLKTLISDAQRTRGDFIVGLKGRELSEIQSFLEGLEVIENRYSRISKELNHILECYRYEAEHGWGTSEGKDFFSLRESACIALSLIWRDFPKEHSNPSDTKVNSERAASAACDPQNINEISNSSKYNRIYDLYISMQSKKKEDEPVNLRRAETRLKKAIAELFPPLQQKTEGSQHSDASASTGSVVSVSTVSSPPTPAAVASSSSYSQVLNATRGVNVSTSISDAPSSKKPLQALMVKLRALNKTKLRSKPGYTEKVRRKWEEIIKHYPDAEKPEFVKKAYGESAQKEAVSAKASATAPASLANALTSAISHPPVEVAQKEKVTKEESFQKAGPKKQEAIVVAPVLSSAPVTAPSSASSPMRSNVLGISGKHDEKNAKSQSEVVSRRGILVPLPLPHRRDIQDYFLWAYNRHPEKLIELGNMLYTGEIMGYRDYAASLCCYQYAMDRGVVAAQKAYANRLFKLGYEYLTGVMRPADVHSAEILFMIASGYGNSFAAHNLGKLYYDTGRHKEAISHLSCAWNQWKSPITSSLLRKLYGISVV